MKKFIEANTGYTGFILENEYEDADDVKHFDVSYYFDPSNYSFWDTNEIQVFREEFSELSAKEILEGAKKSWEENILINVVVQQWWDEFAGEHNYYLQLNITDIDYNVSITDVEEYINRFTENEDDEEAITEDSSFSLEELSNQVFLLRKEVRELKETIK